MNFLASARCLPFALAPRPGRDAGRDLQRRPRCRPPGTGTSRCRPCSSPRRGCRSATLRDLDRHRRLAAADHLLLLLEGRAVRALVEVALLVELDVALEDRAPARVGERLLAVEHVLREVRVLLERRRRRDRVRDQLRDPRRLVAERDAGLARGLDLVARSPAARSRSSAARSRPRRRAPSCCRWRRSASRPRSTCTSCRRCRAAGAGSRGRCLDPRLVGDVREHARGRELLDRHRRAVAGPDDEQVGRVAAAELRAQRGLQIVDGREARLDRDVRRDLLVLRDQLLERRLVVGDVLERQRDVAGGGASLAPPLSPACPSRMRTPLRPRPRRKIRLTSSSSTLSSRRASFRSGPTDDRVAGRGLLRALEKP